MNGRNALVTLGVAVLVVLGIWLNPAGKRDEAKNDQRAAEQSAEVQQKAPLREKAVHSGAPEAPASRPQVGRQLPFSDPDVVREVNKTLDLIEKGGPFPYRQDGVVFQNREGRLPRGEYREYTVKTPGSPDRGARRIVVEQGSGRRYYTGDHYRTFTLIEPRESK